MRAATIGDFTVYVAFSRQQLLVTTLPRENFCGVMDDEKVINYDKYVLFVLYM